MSTLGAFAPVVRLILTLLLCLVPTLALFGLFRGLERIRDDDLITEWAANSDEEVSEVDLAAVLAGTADSGESDARSPSESPRASNRSASPDSTEEQAVHCRRCGAANPEGVTFCAECIGRL
jgi:hypothetical protein